jgi:hypothetical protein
MRTEKSYFCLTIPNTGSPVSTHWATARSPWHVKSSGVRQSKWWSGVHQGTLPLKRLTGSMGRYCRLINPLSGSTLLLTSKIACVRQSKMGCIRAHFPLKWLIILNQPIDLSPYNQNFDLGKSRQIFHHSLKEHHKISNIPKFRCEML